MYYRENKRKGLTNERWENQRERRERNERETRETEWSLKLKRNRRKKEEKKIIANPIEKDEGKTWVKKIIWEVGRNKKLEEMYVF
jgi:cell shape-determining protein MreC